MPNSFTLLALLLAFESIGGWERFESEGLGLHFCKLPLKHFMPKSSEGLNFPSKTFNSISSRSIRFLNLNFPNLSCHVYVHLQPSPIPHLVMPQDQASIHHTCSWLIRRVHNAQDHDRFQCPTSHIAFGTEAVGSDSVFTNKSFPWLCRIF